MDHSVRKNPELISRAVIINRGKILLCQGVGKKSYFLPGGHVEMFEMSENALRREIKEELGVNTRWQALIGIAENIYHDGKRGRHEVNLVYRVTLGTYKIKSMEDDLVFTWMPVSKLSRARALPRSLFRAITKWARDKKHFAVYQIDKK